MPIKKLGLALSGGGFRASFFHIGVLAQMARLGLLRHVDVISTVSGGSIIGAQYFLHVKKLLDNKPIDDVVDTDYLDIVQQIEKDFLKSVQKNFRMRTFLDPFKNIKMTKPNYSRSDRIGELYDKELYRHVAEKDRKKRIEMREIKIKPKEVDQDTKPDVEDPGSLGTKVPILLINATTLNSGHNWRFEVDTMGEPDIPSGLRKEIDKNLELIRPQYYDDINTKRRNIGLGIAVSASACVPGLFPPLAISELYPNNIRVELVDGGVHDNQGIQGLIDNNCTQFVVSDSSGQMKDELDPSTGTISVLSRSFSISADRVREEQLIGLMEDQKDKGAEVKDDKLQVAFMHLRKNLKPEVALPIVTEGENDNSKNEDDGPTPEAFGVNNKVQKRLAHVRTDLDSFTDVEAYSLMLDGYLMSEKELRDTFDIENNYPVAETDEKYKWNFLKIKPWINNPSDSYLKQLDVASEILFKVFRLSWKLTTITALILAAIIYFSWSPLVSYIREHWDQCVTYGQIAIAVIGLLSGLLPQLSRAFKIFRFLRTPSEFFVRFFGRTVLSLIGSIFIVFHLLIFDRLFLWLGKVKRLKMP